MLPWTRHEPGVTNIKVWRGQDRAINEQSGSFVKQWRAAEIMKKWRACTPFRGQDLSFVLVDNYQI